MVVAAGTLILLFIGLAAHAVFASSDTDVPRADDRPKAPPIDLEEYYGLRLIDPDPAIGRRKTPDVIDYDADLPGFGRVQVVEGFAPGIDQLVLEFDRDQPLPQVILNTELEPGSTAVFGGTALMAILRGTLAVRETDILLQWHEDEMKDPVFAETFDDAAKVGAPSDSPLVLGDDARVEEPEAYLDLPIFADFDPEADIIELCYPADPSMDPNVWPQVALDRSANNVDMIVLLDGVPVLRVTDARGLTLDHIDLVPEQQRAAGGAA